MALTALASKKFEDLALGAGCDAFLSKPVLGAALVGTIVRLLAKRRDSSRPDLGRLAR